VPPPSELEFGLFDWIDLAPGADPAAIYDARLALLAEADRGGFAVCHIAEHHGTPLGLAPSPAVFLAAAARTTSRIRLAATTFVVPLYDPLRLAEEIAMLDQLSHGRLEVGVGRGSSPFEAAMFGLTAEQAAERFQRLLPVLLDALATGGFRRPGAEPIPLHVAVRQRPHPPLWYPTSNPDSIPRLGERGYHVLFGFGFVAPPLDVVREQSRIFFENFHAARATGAASYAVPGSTPRFGIMRHVLVAPTDEEAMALARPAFATHFDAFAHLWRRNGSERFAEPMDLDQLVADGRMFVGSPATVATRIAAAVDGTHVNYVAAAFSWGSLAHEAQLRSLRLFRDEVVPALRGSSAVDHADRPGQPQHHGRAAGLG
jgi:alkanesulfonate monooxygenase SsuD/methylene tetrahydromethanopterin reductase-like flavin-dependent oxidoreductase (luciferase family)